MTDTTLMLSNPSSSALELAHTVMLIDLPRRRGRVERRRNFVRRGIAATEFAIVAPVFFLMVIGFIEFGRALMVQQVLINASRVGARMASTTGATTTAVQTAVRDYSTGVAVPGVTVAVSP